MAGSSARLLTVFPTDKLRLTADGRVIDFLDGAITRPNTPEERVRQEYARKLHFEYGYPKELMLFEAPVNIGSETKHADIAIYENATALKRKDQSHISIIVGPRPRTKRKV